MRYNPKTVSKELASKALYAAALRARLAGKTLDKSSEEFVKLMEYMRGAQDFFIEEDIALEMHEMEYNEKQDFVETLRSPYPKIFINFPPNTTLPCREGKVLVHCIAISDVSTSEEKMADAIRVEALVNLLQSKSVSLFEYWKGASRLMNITIFFTYEGEKDVIFMSFSATPERMPMIHSVGRETNINDTDIIGAKWAMNILNYLNARNIEYVPYNGGTKTNEHRARQGKPPLPTDFYWLRANYPQEISDYTPAQRRRLHVGFNYTFDVRGHFRTYKAERYVNKKGKTTWIGAYRKGTGVYIPKNYYYEWMRASNNEGVD